MSWVVSQLGSRERYAVPSALHAAGKLEALITDTWLTRPWAKLVRSVVPSLAGRRRDDIPDRLVRHETLGRIRTDVKLQRSRLPSWEAIMQRNEWFGTWATGQLAKISAENVFSFSYTARRPFKEAGRRGMKRILDQIDGAWVEESIWREASSAYHAIEAEVDEAPPDYWKLWREELDMADAIIVNSEWSRSLLLQAGGSAAKILVIPLVYACEAGSVGHGAEGVGCSPAGSISAGQNANFPKARLRALFLGSVCLRKGVGQLLDAIRMLRHESVDFAFAGPVGVRVPDDIRAMPHVRFLGPVDRAMAERLYREADVFLFPTLSDGFGRTQLEALGHGCPVIASTNCAHVVENRVNGLVLEDVTPDNIAEKIMALLRDRDLLAQLKANAHVPDKFHPRHLAPALLALEH